MSRQQRGKLPRIIRRGLFRARAERNSAWVRANKMEDFATSIVRRSGRMALFFSGVGIAVGAAATAAVFTCMR